MKLNAPKPKLVESDKWQVEEDDEDEELSNALNTVQKALDSGSSKV